MTELIVPIKMMRSTDWTVPRARESYSRYVFEHHVAFVVRPRSLPIDLHFHPAKDCFCPLRYHCTFCLSSVLQRLPAGHELFTYLTGDLLLAIRREYSCGAVIIL